MTDLDIRPGSLKWPNGLRNWDGVVLRIAKGSQSQDIEAGGIYSQTPWRWAVDRVAAENVPVQHVAMDVRLPENWHPNIVGKLPGGMFGGTGELRPASPAVGQAWNVRPVWGRDGRIGLYVWDMTTPAGSYPEVRWSGPNLLRPGATHRIETRVAVNTPGKADGECRLWLDGVEIERRVFFGLADAASPQIEGFCFGMFFGGSGQEYAAPDDFAVVISNARRGAGRL